MGKIKSKSVKRAAEVLVGKGIEFTDSFEKNKKVLEGVTPSKKLRNQMAGLLAKLKKRELAIKAKK
jgi:ribosomal protein S17E